MIPIKGGLAERLGVTFSGNRDVQELEEEKLRRETGRAKPDHSIVTEDPAKVCDKSLSGD